MKTGKSLSELATELDRRSGLKNDYIVDTREIGLDVVPDVVPAEAGRTETVERLVLNLNGHGYFNPSEHTSRQIAARTGIPWKYYEKVGESSPDLLKNNVRHWFDINPEKRMVRTMEDGARAFLSDRYLRVENDKVAQMALESISECADAQVLSADVTDRKLYMKFVFPGITGEVKGGDAIHPGVLISNSEIGAGSLNVQGFFFRSYCLNGCVWGKDDTFGFRRTHRGKQVIEGVDYKILSDEAVAADDKALMLQVRDTVAAAASPDLFEQMIAQMRTAADSSKIVQPEKAIEVLGQDYSLSDAERSRALINLIEDRDYSKWGALNAVTKLANDADSYDRASDLEAIGGQILAMPNQHWEKIAVAA